MFEIQTRQKTDVLFEFSEPLDLFGLFVSPVREVSGYAKITILAVADQPFGLNVEEAVSVADDGTGRFVQTDATITAALVGGQYQIATSVQPFGKYMKMVVGNLGAAMSLFDFLAKGVPLP